MLHRLCCLEMVVPDVAATAAFYRDFGLQEVAPGQAGFDGRRSAARARFGSRARRCADWGSASMMPDDLDRIAQNLQSLGAPCERGDGALETRDPALDIALRISIAPPDRGASRRANARGPRGALMPEEGEPPRPRKLSHVVLGSPDPAIDLPLAVRGSRLSA